MSGDPQTNVEVDFEITGANDPDDSDSPTSPDFTCNTAGGSSCTLTQWGDAAAETSETGTSTIRAWIDDDQDNTTFDADAAEGADETTAGGNITDPDDTDVVTKTWFAAFPADAVLECTPEDATNPATGANSTEQYTCTLTDRKGTGDTADDTPVSGINLDAEVLAGSTANDPDNGSTAPPDFNNACTTDASGQCVVNIPAGESQAGDADICIWADPDNDTGFDLAETTGDDGGECDEGPNTETANQTDVVEKTWIAAGTAQNLDAEPESDQNQEGTAHTVTATVTDINGDPVQGVPVDFIISGRNAGVACDQVTTNASGVATCTYTDVGTAVGPGFATDDIDVCTDTDDNDACDQGTEGPNDETSVALSDRVQKFWFDAIPQAAQVVVDMNGCGGETSGDATATNSVGVIHEVCISVYDDATLNTPLPGETVTVTSDGPGTFVDCNTDATDGVDETEDLGDEVTVVTDQNGNAFVCIYSEVTGNQVVTATADSQSDSGTKTWVAGMARNIECTPPTATNLVNTTHTIDCEVTDLFANPVPGEAIDATESGPGAFTNCPNPDDNETFYEQPDAVVCETTSDQNGIASFTLTSAQEGTQSFEAAIDDDSTEGTSGRDTQTEGDDDDECDLNAGSTHTTDPFGQAFGEDPEEDTRAATAGNCFDTASKTWSTTITPTGGFPRTVTLEASKNKIRYGKTFSLTATVQPGDVNTPASCIGGVTVEFERTVVGETTIEQIGTATTNAEGIATLELTGDKNANYVAHLDQTAECSEANSIAEPVLVKKQVKLKISDQTPRKGTRVTFKVKVLPCGGPDGPGHEGDRAQLYKTVGGVLAKVAAKRSNDNCVAKFKRRVNKAASFQGRSPKQDADHQGGKSRAKAVQPHR